MGYTNYWHQYEDFTKDEWHQIKVFYHGLILVHGGGAYLEADHIINDETNGGDHIRFNGINGQSYETFYLDKYANTTPDYEGANPAFNFCKTARNPYDAIVWAVLCYAKYVKGNRDMFMISNDDGDHYGKE